MFRHQFSMWAASLCLAVSLTILPPWGVGRPAFAQEPSSNILVIEGEELQNCIVTVRYFRNRQLTKSVVTRVTLASGRIEEAVEAQHEGIEVYVQSASVPMTASILAEGKVLDENKTNSSGIAKLSIGKVGRVPFQPISIDLTRREAAIVERLAKSIGDGTSLETLVSDSPAAAIDGPCFDVLLREIKSLIGSPVDAESASEGWLAYGNSESSRNLAGIVKCDKGVSGFRITLENNRIVNVVPNCPALPDNYFRDPVNVQNYVRQAKQLTQHIFAGDSKKAHELYSPRFQPQVSTDQLAELCATVQQRFGKNLQTIDFKRYELMDYNFQQQSNLLNIDMLLESDTGARCISRTAFSIPSGRNQVGRAHLGAINVFELFQSSHPKYAQVTEKLLTELSRGMRAHGLVAQYPEELRQLAKLDETQALLTRLAEFLAGAEPKLDFDLWTVSGSDQVTAASGPVSFGENDYFLELQFAGEDQILGFSFFGPSLSESTFNLFEFDSQLVELAQRFWNQLLREEAESAYAMLHPEFQKQFSLEELKSQLETPQEESSPLKSVVTDHIRLSNNPFRATPLMVSAFLTAFFEEGAPLPLNCELVMRLADDDPNASVYDFSNEFEEDFPVAKVPTAEAGVEGLEAMVNAFINGDSTQLLELVAPESRPSIDRTALDAYLKRLNQIGGKLMPTKSVSRTVEYSSGIKRYRCNAILGSEQGDSFSLEAWYHQGYLEKFSISDSRLIDFVSLIEDTSETEKRVEAFIKSWMAAAPDVGSFLLPSAGSEALLTTLEALRRSFTAAHGNFDSCEITSKHPYEGGGVLQFGVTLTGVNGTQLITVSVELGAFGGLISGITF